MSQHLKIYPSRGGSPSVRAKPINRKGGYLKTKIIKNTSNNKRLTNYLRTRKREQDRKRKILRKLESLGLQRGMIRLISKSRFGESIRYFRGHMNWTQRQMASYLGVRYRTCQDWEYGRRVPRGKNLRRPLSILLSLEKGEIPN